MRDFTNWVLSDKFMQILGSCNPQPCKNVLAITDYTVFPHCCGGVLLVDSSRLLLSFAGMDLTLAQALPLRLILWPPGWMASLTWWTWVWASFRTWWRTGKPGGLQSMGSERAGHDWATEQLPLSTPLPLINWETPPRIFSPRYPLSALF